MDPSFCDLEFFDFKDSSDEEIKEIQAILKGPKSEGCVKLPWETFMKTKCSGNLPPNEDAKAESVEDVVEETPQVLTTTHSTLLPPVVPLPPAAETYVSLPTTVGPPPYHNTPYFVSRTLPYLRTYPPMGMTLFACPLPGEASPYGIVPMTPAETTEAGFKRQSGQRGSSKNKRLGSESPESVNPYPEGCPTSVPLVPLSVPPPTFVGGNLPMHGYPPGLHTSPAMYYVPVFNHPYGGYIQAPGPPMMLPVNIATTDLKCPPPASVEETLPTDNLNESPPRDINGVGFKSPKDNKGSCELTQENCVGHVDSPQNDLGLTSPTVDLEEKAGQAEIDCQSGKVLVADNCDPAQEISAHAPEDFTPVGHSDNKSNSLPNVGDTAAKINVPEHNDITSNKSKSPPSDPPNKDSLPETDHDGLEETVVPLEVSPKDSSSPVIQKTPTAPAPPTKDAAKRVSLSEVAKPVDPHRPSKCWADLFKRPSSAVNGFESPPEPNGRRNCDPPEPRKVATGEGRPPRVKRGVSNGKVPSTNSLH